MISAEIKLISVISGRCWWLPCVFLVVCLGGRGGVTVGRVNVLVIPGRHHFTVGFSLSCTITYYNEITSLRADIL